MTHYKAKSICFQKIAQLCFHVTPQHSRDTLTTFNIKLLLFFIHQNNISYRT